MKKRTVALMLCAMMAFGAAGCGAKETDQASIRLHQKQFLRPYAA